MLFRSYVHPYNIVSVDISVNNAAAAGVIFIGAAGNYKHKIDVPGGIDYNNRWISIYGESTYYHRGSSPTSASSMINVGALDTISIEQKAYFSETGPRVDIYAPGVMIMGAYANKPYETYAVAEPRKAGHYLNKITGTSQATPQVAGYVACILQLHPEWNVTKIKDFISTNASNGKLTTIGADTYANSTSLQGGTNKILKMPYKNPVRGKIGA